MRNTVIAALFVDIVGTFLWDRLCVATFAWHIFTVETIPCCFTCVPQTMIPTVAVFWLVCTYMLDTNHIKASQAKVTAYDVFSSLRKLVAAGVSIALLSNDGGLVSLGMIYFMYKQGYFF